MSIMMPEKKPSMFGKIAPIAGTVIGGVAGAFAGNPVLGASLGGAAGSAAAGIAKKDALGAVGSVAQGAAAAGGAAASASAEAAKQGAADAMQRRVDMMGQTALPASEPMASDSTAALDDGMKALSTLPPEAQQQFGPAISGAYNQALRQKFMRT